ncbi:tRNA epoxyqueuosine(34) reductase QueG [Candidatus Binatus sp.]|uniref:tRNA epoxyqueuosine(34) reductase QueG n=1 Tax=Candidatus Binatus sp. TaxID=2811406 RepID=UPI00272CC103|nr:tRNA epoxyqueuosine(34) reductase QueG [Candidatus Binatus sp.]
MVEAAHRQGFALVGFALLRRLDERDDFYRRWLQDGRHGAMEYLALGPERRIDPRTLDARFKSIVSLAYPYAPPQTAAATSIDWRAQMRGRIAAYALGRDYHDYVLNAACAVAEAIADARPGAITRAYVDTGPVFEREWAAAARLGWFGKNTMLLNRDQGSYFFLAEIFTDAEFEPSREPYREHCGTCRRCLDLCPTGALADGYVMESRLCISYQTIENRGAIPVALRPKLANWIFGCDVCNEVCPWNGDASSEVNSKDLIPFLPDLLALDEGSFSRRFTGSAVKRAKRRGLLRNVAVALGNTRNPDAVSALARSLDSEKEPLVRAHAAWALGQIGGVDARRVLEAARARESDDSVLAEIRAARKII